MAVKKAQKNKFPMYKSRPLVRSGDVIYYGNMNEDYIIRLQIKSEKEVNDLKVAEKVSVQLMSTDMDLPERKRVIKKSEKSGLYLSLDIAEAWLDRAING